MLEGKYLAGFFVLNFGDRFQGPDLVSNGGGAGKEEVYMKIGANTLVSNASASTLHSMGLTR